MTISNLPLPDQLADVRAKIKSLEQTESELKQSLIANPDLRTGANWAVEIKEVLSNRTDLKELCAGHPDLVAEYTFPSTATHVVLLAVTDDGELVSARSVT